jgi:hypothetical protein
MSNHPPINLLRATSLNRNPVLESQGLAELLPHHARSYLVPNLLLSRQVPLESMALNSAHLSPLRALALLEEVAEILSLAQILGFRRLKMREYKSEGCLRSFSHPNMKLHKQF